MAELRLVRELSWNTQPKLLNTLAGIVLGDQDPQPFEGNRQYVRGDLILTSMGNHWQISQCIVDQSTVGVFVMNEWALVSLADIATGKQPAAQTTYVSEIEPTSPSCQVWYQVLDVRTALDPSEHQTILLSGDAIAIQDDQPSDPNAELWVDTND